MTSFAVSLLPLPTNLRPCTGISRGKKHDSIIVQSCEPTSSAPTAFDHLNLSKTMAPSIEEEYQRKFGKTSMRGELSTPPHAGMAPLMSSVPRPETWPSTFTSTASQPTHPPILATEVQDISAALHRAVLDGTLTRDPVDGESVIRKFGAQEHLTSQQPATTIATMPAITFAAKPTPVNATTPANATMPASATSHETVMLGRVTDDHSKLIQYSPNALNTIGKVCSEQLTPLSTVQAMLPLVHALCTLPRL